MKIKKRCKAKTAIGEQCNRFAVVDGLCLSHFLKRMERANETNN